MASSPPAQILSPSQSQLGAGLWRAAVVMLGLMPLGMAVAHRSSPLFLTVSAVFALSAAAVGGELRATAGAASRALATPLGAATLAFLAWTAVSLTWSDAPARSAHAFGEFWLSVGAAFVVALALPARMRRSDLWLVAGATGLACFLILFELRTGLAWRRTLGMRSASYIFNRSVLTILVVAVPLLTFLPPRRPGAVRWAVARGVLAVLVVLAALASESGAARLAAAVFLVAFGAAHLWPVAVRRLVLFGVVAAMVLAPFSGPIAEGLIPDFVHDRLGDSHSRDRIDIWSSFGAAVREEPVVGGGFGVSPAMGETPVAARVPAEHRTLLAVGHPHNGFLQIWVELGAVGAILAAGVLVLILQSMRDMPRRRMAPRLALFSAIATVSLVGHGAWQGWWPAAIGAAIVWFRLTDRLSEGME